MDNSASNKEDMTGKMSGERLRSAIPWQARIAAKLLLARLPLPYGFWRRLALFRHGAMADPSYAYEVFSCHYKNVKAHLPRASGGLTVLELGPGDSLFSALVARAFGFERSYLVDSGYFAEPDPARYRLMAAYLKDLGCSIPEVSSSDSLGDILQAFAASYLTEGLASLREIADGSIDFIWSNAVLEHVRRRDFLPTLRELRRIIRTTGVCSHRVDLRDHVGGALNNLRFSENFWENDKIAGSGFYTNRLRFTEMLGIFKEAGFSSEVTATTKWDRLPTPRNRLSRQWQGYSEDELLVSGFDVILRPL